MGQSAVHFNSHRLSHPKISTPVNSVALVASPVHRPCTCKHHRPNRLRTSDHNSCLKTSGQNFNPHRSTVVSSSFGHLQSAQNQPKCVADRPRLFLQFETPASQRFSRFAIPNMPSHNFVPFKQIQPLRKPKTSPQSNKEPWKTSLVVNERTTYSNLCFANRTKGLHTLEVLEPCSNQRVFLIISEVLPPRTTSNKAFPSSPKD